MNKIPVPNIFLYEFDIDVQIVDESLQQFLSEQKNTKPIYASNVPELCHIELLYDKNGNYVPRFNKKLFDKLQGFVDDVSKIHFPETTNLAICDAWLVKNPLGKKSGLHKHGYSIFSGLVYLTDHEKSETVFVANDMFHQNHTTLFPDVVKNTYAVPYKPKKGKVLIWQSDLFHYSNAHTDTKVRYTLAFNTWFTGLVSNNATGWLRSNVIDAETWSNSQS